MERVSCLFFLLLLRAISPIDINISTTIGDFKSRLKRMRDNTYRISGYFYKVVDVKSASALTGKRTKKREFLVELPGKVHLVQTAGRTHVFSDDLKEVRFEISEDGKGIDEEKVVVGKNGEISIITRKYPEGDRPRIVVNGRDVTDASYGGLSKYIIHKVRERSNISASPSSGSGILQRTERSEYADAILRKYNGDFDSDSGPDFVTRAVKKNDSSPDDDSSRMKSPTNKKDVRKRSDGGDDESHYKKRDGGDKNGREEDKKKGNKSGAAGVATCMISLIIPIIACNIL